MLAASSFEGAWWVVNSPVVSVMSLQADGTVLSVHCESEKYSEEQICDNKGETSYIFNQAGDALCSAADERTPFCWYRLYQSHFDKNILYLRADPTNSRPGLSYVLTSRRLFPGVWPMK